MGKATRKILYYEWITFIRNKFQRFLLGVTLVFSGYAIYYGYSEIEGHRDTIRDVLKIQEQEFHEYRMSFKEALSTTEAKQRRQLASDPAFAWHRHGYHAILHPDDYALLAIGQSDLFPFYYRLTGMSLHYQLFENELANPVKLYVGNFDLAFVIVYLFPLLIIAFTYNLYSGEKENGTLLLLSIQSVSLRKIMIVRLGFYFTLVTALGIFLSATAMVASGNITNKTNYVQVILWLCGTTIYCMFWYALMFLIASFRRSSSVNAITAAGCWLLFLIVIPSFLNILVTVKYPLNSAALAGLTRRTSLENDNDDNEVSRVIMEFITNNPEYSGAEKLMQNNKLAKAYAAFTSLKDVSGKKEIAHYHFQLRSRHDWTKKFHWINPAVNMQDMLTRIVQTDVDTFLQFQAAIEAYHKKITAFYFRKLFWDKAITPEDYSSLPVFRMDDDPQRLQLIITGLAKIILTAIVLFIAASVTIVIRKKA